MKKVIKLTESDLHNIVRESVKKIIKEWGDPLDDEPLNRWYKDNPGIEPPEDFDEYYDNEDEFMTDDDDSGWDERWR